MVAAATSDEPLGSSKSILDAFYYGKAFAETVNERLGAALDDLLSELGKQDAERRESMRWGRPYAPILLGSKHSAEFKSLRAWVVSGSHCCVRNNMCHLVVCEPPGMASPSKVFQDSASYMRRHFQEEVEERAQTGMQEAGAQPSLSGAASGGSPMTFRAGNSFMAGTEPAAAGSPTGRPTINGDGRQAVIATPPDLQACLLASHLCVVEATARVLQPWLHASICDVTLPEQCCGLGTGDGGRAARGDGIHTRCCEAV